MTAIWKWHQAGAALPASELPPPDQGLAALYDAHYRSLTQLASLLTASPRLAEDIVQDAFVALHSAWRQLRDDDDALLYLQQTVVQRARSCASPCPGGRPTAAQAESCMLAALRSFPAPQREALVLSYYAGLPEARIAHVMGIRPGAVRSHLARGLSSLQDVEP
ncbi:MAG: sigma factor-like helix-turn-helix DNA-binding protein [Actinomycetota bacterium]